MRLNSTAFRVLGLASAMQEFEERNLNEERSRMGHRTTPTYRNPTKRLKKETKVRRKMAAASRKINRRK